MSYNSMGTIRMMAISFYCALNEVDWNPDDPKLVAHFEDWYVRATTNEPAVPDQSAIIEAAEALLNQAEHVWLGAQTPLDIRDAAKNLAEPIMKLRAALCTHTPDRYDVVFDGWKEDWK